jgi:hypothetical protein
MHGAALRQHRLANFIHRRRMAGAEPLPGSAPVTPSAGSLGSRPHKDNTLEMHRAPCRPSVMMMA